MDEQMRTFLEKYHSAAMITLRSDGTARVTRVGVALVGGKVWSSGTQTRVRTQHLRRDPLHDIRVRCGVSLARPREPGNDPRRPRCAGVAPAALPGDAAGNGRAGGANRLVWQDD